MGDAMTVTVRPVLGPIRTAEEEHAEATIATASPQQREAIVEEVCQAILIESGSVRASEPG